MESILEKILIVLVILNSIYLFVTLKNIQNLEDSFKKFRAVTIQLNEDILNSIEKNAVDRPLQNQKDVLDTAKPMKTNNWDSIRKAFKGPVRVDKDE